LAATGVLGRINGTRQQRGSDGGGDEFGLRFHNDLLIGWV
jgi:hypothetical protein